MPDDYTVMIREVFNGERSRRAEGRTFPHERYLKKLKSWRVKK